MFPESLVAARKLLEVITPAANGLWAGMRRRVLPNASR